MRKRKFTTVSSAMVPRPGDLVVGRKRVRVGPSRNLITGRLNYSVARSRGARVINPERKYFDSYIASTAVAEATSWIGTEVDPVTLNTLFCPTQGTDINNRIGRKVYVHRLSLRGRINVTQLADQTGVASYGVNFARLIVYQDLQTNGAQAQGEDLMSSPGTAAAYLAMKTFQNTANFGKFRVLKDMDINMVPPPMTYDGTNVEFQGVGKDFKISIRFKKPVLVTFNAVAGGTVGDIVDNSFHVICNCNSSASSTAIWYQCRTVYTDV